MRLSRLISRDYLILCLRSVAEYAATVAIAGCRKARSFSPRNADLFARPLTQSTLYVSTLGEALESNVQNLVSRTSGDRSAIGNATSEQVLTAVEDSVQAMSDDILEAFAAAALTQSNAIELHTVGVTTLGIEVGEYPYIVAVVVYQGLALLGIVVASILSRFWTMTPAFDYSEIGSMTTAASLGTDRRDAGLDGRLLNWRREPSDLVLRQVTAQYRQTHLGEPPSVHISIPP